MTDERKDPKTLLAEAIKKRDELNTFIKILQEMSGEGLADQQAMGGSASAAKKPDLTPSGDISDPASVVYPGLFFGKSQPQAAKLLLERVRRPLKTKVIVECLAKGGLIVGGKSPSVNLWGILNRSKETFAQVPKAGWGLVDWYDAAALAKIRKEASETGEDENGEKKDEQ